MKKAIYLRKSRQGEEQDSLKTHRSVLVKMAKDNNWTYDVYEEIVSGDSDNKIKLDELRSNLDKYDGILCMDIDRLSRSKIEAFQLELELADANVKVITPSGTYDFSDDSQNMMYSFKAIFASAEHKKIKQRMKAGKINRFKNGEYSFGNPPLGYNVENKKLVINEHEAELVKSIFELSLNGYGRDAIEEKIGVLAGTVRRVLSNQIYIGNATIRVRDSQGEVMETLSQKCPAIIDIETFVKVQDEIKRRNVNPLRVRGVVRSWLQGLCRCQECGNQMIVSNTQQGVFVLKCKTPRCPTSGIKKSYVENYVLDQLDDVLSVLNGVLEDKLKESAPNTLGDEINALRGLLSDSERSLVRLKDSYFNDGDIDKNEFKDRKSKIDTERNELSLKLKALELKQARDNGRKDIEELKILIADIHDMAILDDVIEQHKIMTRLIDKIEYSRIVPKGVNRKKANETHPPLINIVYRTWD